MLKTVQGPPVTWTPSAVSVHASSSLDHRDCCDDIQLSEFKVLNTVFVVIATTGSYLQSFLNAFFLTSP